MGSNDKFSETIPRHGVITHERTRTYMILIKNDNQLAEAQRIISFTHDDTYCPLLKRMQPTCTVCGALLFTQGAWGGVVVKALRY